MKKLNLIRKIIKFPFGLLLFPIWAVMGFFMTDWENQYEKDFYKKSLKEE